MSKNKINKVIIVSLSEKFSSEVAKCIADDLSMFFCDCTELLQYDFIGENIVDGNCSLAHIGKVERGTFVKIASFENIVASIRYEHLVKYAKYFVHNSAIVLINLPKSFLKATSVSFVDYDNRVSTLKALATCEVSVRKCDKEFVKEKILNVLGGIL